MSQSITKARDGFTSTFGVLAATLGSAVGLGNIWKFPYLTGENGGAGFLLVYVIATLLVGLPVMISEIMLGREARTDAVSGLIKLAPKGQPWWLIAERPGRVKTLKQHPRKNKTAINIEYMKASIRARVEHPFRIIKRQFGFVKARYKGLLKNDNQLAMLFTLANLFRVDQMIRQWERSQ